MTSTAPYEVDFGHAPDDLFDSILANAKRRAGLLGEYADAQSEYGDAVVSLVDSGRGAFLFGKCGRGKTLAASHAVRVMVERGVHRGESRRIAWLVTAKRLLDDLRGDYGTINRDVMDRAEGTRLLAIDDLGAEAINERSIETLTRIIDTRSMSGLPTVFTSNYPLGKLRDLWGEVSGARMASRIGGVCELIEITGPDWRLL